MPNVGDTVMVIYHGPQDKYKIGWDGREKELAKGKEVFIPFEMACNWFGDPRSAGNMSTVRDHKQTVGWIPDRATEVRRLRIVYGVQHAHEGKIFLDDTIPLPLDNAAASLYKRIDATIPRVELYDLETRERLYTVLEDPAGDHVSSAFITVTKEERQEKRIKQLEDLVESLVSTQRPTSGLMLPGQDGNGKAVAPRPPPSPSIPPSLIDEPEVASDRELIDSTRSGSHGLPADK